MGRPAAPLKPLDERNRDALRDKAARDGSLNLLRAQLRAGQHLLTIDVARDLGAQIGLRRDAVRAAAGDTTIAKGTAA